MTDKPDIVSEGGLDPRNKYEKMAERHTKALVESMKQTISETREKVRKPLTEEEISETCDTWIIDSISIEEVIIIVRRTERAHGIGVEDAN